MRQKANVTRGIIMILATQASQKTSQMVSLWLRRLGLRFICLVVLWAFSLNTSQAADLSFEQTPLRQEQSDQLNKPLFTLIHGREAPSSRFPPIPAKDFRPETRCLASIVPTLGSVSMDQVRSKARSSGGSPSDPALMLSSLRQVNRPAYQVRATINGHVRYVWFQAYNSARVDSWGSFRVAGLKPGTHSVHVVIRTLPFFKNEPGKEFSGSFNLVVSPEAINQKAIDSSNYWYEHGAVSFKKKHDRGASNPSSISSHVSSMRKRVIVLLEKAGQSYDDIAPLIAEMEYWIAEIPKTQKPGNHPVERLGSWRDYQAKMMHSAVFDYVSLLERIGLPGAIEKIEYQIAQLSAAGADPFRLYLPLSNAVYGMTGNADLARQHRQTRHAGMIAENQRENRQPPDPLYFPAQSLIPGNSTSSGSNLAHVPRAVVAPPKNQKPQPTERLQPPPKAESDKPDESLAEKPDENIDEEHLPRIEAMERILEGVEQPLQEGLTQIRILATSQIKLRQKMREHSKLKRGIDDEATKNKIQERINKSAQSLRDHATEIRRLVAETEQVAKTAHDQILAIYNEDDFGELDYKAVTLVELIAARSELLDVQIALASQDGPRAQILADKIKQNYRLNGAGYYLDGMALIQQGKLLDALAVFRQSKQYQKTSPGESFEALERQTEIQVLRSLKSLAAESGRAFDEDYTRWVSAKAELDVPAGQTTFEWLKERFLVRGWYDTISGVTGSGIGEADERGKEVGLVMDDMAVNQIGLNFIIALRRDATLQDIQAFTADQLKEAAQKRWGHDLPDDQLERMRRAMRHAFEMPDMKLLASGDAHLQTDAFTGSLAQQVELKERWAQAAELGAVGGNFLNGWTALTTLAPSAKLSFAGTGTMMRAQQATQTFKNTVTLGEYFAASKPVTAGIEALSKTKTGRAALEAAAQTYEFSERGLPENITVMAANMVVDGGAAYAAQEYLGENGAMLVDAFSALGGTNPELYGQAFRNLSRQQARATTQALVRRAAQQRRSAALLENLLDDLPEDAAGLPAFRQRIESSDLPSDSIDRLQGVATALETQNPAVIEQAFRDAERLTARQARLADQAQQAATHLAPRSGTAAASEATITGTVMPDAPATRLPAASSSGPADTVSAVNTARPTVGDPLNPSTRLPSTTSPTDLTGDLASTARAPVGDPLSTPTRQPSTAPPDNLSNTARVPVGDPLSTNTNTPLSTQRATPTTPSGGGTLRADDLLASGAVLQRRGQGASLDMHNPRTPVRAEADRLLASSRFDEAIDAYQHALTELPEGDPSRALILEKLEGARDALAAERTLQTGARGTAESKGPKIFDEPNSAQAAVKDAVLGQDAAERWIDVGPESASKPRFVKDADGNVIAVTKFVDGMADHPEGNAEVLASLLSEELGRGAPRARLSDFIVNVDGKEQRLVIFELMPEGTELADLNPGTGQLLARKQDVAEDFVFSMLLGDGDRHFGNFRITPDEGFVPFDYGLADILPDHPYRQSAAYEPMLELQQLREVRSPNKAQRQRMDALRQQIDGLNVRPDVATLYHHMDPSIGMPKPGAPGFGDHVLLMMGKHMDHGSRSWGAYSKLFDDTMTLEDFLPHIQKLKDKLDQPGVLDKIVGQAMDGHPDASYTRELLKKRLEVMEDAFRQRFGSRTLSLALPNHQSSVIAYLRFQNNSAMHLIAA